uniref:Uncharacterized protein n=1 Tax=viral metagenome TaxID=1070528 RepID=A0A6M3ILK6_9ZZZZ
MTDQERIQSEKEKALLNQSKKFKIKVDGQEKEVTELELIELAQKGDDYTSKTQKLADERKTLQAQQEEIKGLKVIIDEMKLNPELNKTLNKVYSDFKSGKVTKPDTDSNLKRIDKLIKDADDPDQREKLRDIKEMVTELAEEIAERKTSETVKKLEGDIALLRNTSLIGLGDKIEGDIQKLEGKFGKDLVGKYKADITAMALKYPQNSVPKIFKHLCDDTEYETAVLESAKRKEKEELERKKQGSSPGGQGFTAVTEARKDKSGRTNISDIVQRVKERLGKT